MVLKSAQLITSLGKDNPVAQQAWQTRIKPNFRRMFGAQADSLPDQIDDSVMAVAQQIAGGSQESSDPAAVREVDLIAKRMGLTPGTPDYLKFVQTQYGLAPKATGWKYGETASGAPWRAEGDIYEVLDRGTGQWMPYGNKAETPVEPPHNGAILNDDGSVWATFDEMPPEEVAAAKAQQAAQMGGSDAGYEVRGGKVTQIQQPTAQMREDPFTKPTPQLTPYQQQQLAFQQQAAARAEQAAKDAAAIRADNKAAKDREAQARVADAKQTTDLLLTNVRNLRKHPGFGQLGTLGGNAGDAAIPEFVPTDYRGASARLDTIKGQIAIQAMASLKALSSSGATGFGALSEKELGLLTGSIQTLTTSQNNADIVSALEQIEKYLTKAGQAKTAPQAPQNNDDALIKKYLD
jgi:hypothetical protein